MDAKLSMSASSSPAVGGEQLVDLLYHAVLRRPPDPTGRKFYTGLLDQGRSVIEILQLLTRSAEFEAKVLVPSGNLSFGKLDDYDPARDPALLRYADPAFIDTVRRLRRSSIDPALFERLAQECIDETGGAKVAQVDYLRFHHDRFYEIDCIVGNMLSELGVNCHVLDFGLSINSFMMRRLFPAALLSVADRPAVRMPIAKFHKTLVVDLLDDRLESLDLGERFDVIVFSEVIEHVLVHPTKVLRFLLRHLTDVGRVIVTTPNLLSRSKLNLISQRRSPLPPYPANYGRAEALHFHIREYCMGELLGMVGEIGGEVEAYFFSGCWDLPAVKATIPPHELGNICIVFRARRTP